MYGLIKALSNGFLHCVLYSKHLTVVTIAVPKLFPFPQCTTVSSALYKYLLIPERLVVQILIVITRCDLKFLLTVTVGPFLKLRRFYSN